MYVCMYVFGDTNLNAEGVMPLFIRSYLVNCRNSATSSMAMSCFASMRFENGGWWRDEVRAKRMDG